MVLRRITGLLEGLAITGWGMGPRGSSGWGHNGLHGFATGCRNPQSAFEDFPFIGGIGCSLLNGACEYDVNYGCCPVYRLHRSRQSNPTPHWGSNRLHSWWPLASGGNSTFPWWKSLHGMITCNFPQMVFIGPGRMAELIPHRN